jgi:hypothetical protein
MASINDLSDERKQMTKNLKKYLKKKTVLCRHCDSIRTKRVKKAKQKEKRKKYECKSCGKTFNEDRSYYSGYPPWIHQCILRSTGKQIDYDNLIVSLVSEGKKNGVTPPTTRTAIKRIQIRDVRFLEPLEYKLYHNVPSEQWMINHTFLRLPYGKKAYIYNVFSTDPHYWLASVVSPDSPTNIPIATPQSVEMGILKACYSPNILVTNGLKIKDEYHVKDMKHTKLLSSPLNGSQDTTYGAVDVKTLLHHIIRGFAPDTIAYLWALVEINRYGFNFFQKQHSIDGKTSAEAIGLDFRINDWCDLFTIANFLRRTETIPFSKYR